MGKGILKLALTLIVLALGLTLAAQAVVKSTTQITVGGKPYYLHSIKREETEAAIARAYDIDLEELRANNSNLAAGFEPGKIIRIPVTPERPYQPPVATPSAAGSTTGEQIASTGGNVVPADTATTAPASFSGTGSRRMITHTVNTGETAYAIAKRYAVSVATIEKANPGIDITRLGIGQRISIPRSQVGEVTQTEVHESFLKKKEELARQNPGVDFHLVERGETLYTLANTYHTTVETLHRYNADELKDGLKFGSILKIPVSVQVAQTPLSAQAEPERLSRAERRRQAAEAQAQGKPLPQEIPAVTTTPPPVALFSPQTTATEEETPHRRVRQAASDEPVNVLVMLPFTSANGEEKNFTDFYNGLLIAMADLKNEGISVDLNVVNTGRSADVTEQLTRSDAFANADLVIGPVYNEPFETAARHADRQGTPIVSPLGEVSSASPYVYQVAPPAATRTDKWREVIGQGKNVVVVTPQSAVDEELREEIAPLLPPDAKHVLYVSKNTQLRSYLVTDRENVVIVETTNENTTEAILAALSSIQNQISSRTLRSYPIQVIGGSRWTRFPTLNKELFYKLDVTFLTTYYADRSNPRVAAFNNRYILTFGAVPTLYAYRGYDIGKLFVSTLYRYGEHFDRFLSGSEHMPLQVPYRFEETPDGKHTNAEWVLVRYNSDFSITVK
ncbi:MAG: LysM peptidoglycan-binding domain-containing protein [Rikenellaceae bacterium]|jgi:LysM repeat protein|nr:LysM peptidoglycan-binding domain-containing protein [Rikenellaceae bacterium]